jgi:class 3 adenylate cyclase
MAATAEVLTGTLSRPGRAGMHRVTLRFPGDLESRFLAEYAGASVRQVRIALMVAVGLFSIFGVVDVLTPGVGTGVVWLRAGVVLLLLVGLGLTFSRHFERLLQPITAACAGIAGLGLVGIVLATPPGVSDFHHRGLLLLVVAAYTFIRLRFIYATVVSLIVAVSYNAAELVAGDAPLGMVLRSDLYLLTANVIGMVACYAIEFYTRRDFVQRQLLKAEEAQVEDLLLNVLPQPVCERLKRERAWMAESFSEATILFADIAHFTELAAHVTAEEVVALLNRVFSAFDELVEKHQVEKIKTIGDAYMVVGGVPVTRPDHAEAVAELALDMLDAVRRLNVLRDEPLRLRLGIHTGPVVAGVIGTKKFSYDLWGDAVNTASRMESHGLTDAIHVTRSTYERLRSRYVLQRRGVIEVKGKGEMVTYLLLGRRTEAPAAAAGA